MLAIIAPSFNQVSETFVADHAANLAPGHTVLVCNNSLGAERFGHPVLSHLTPDYPRDTALARLDLKLRLKLRRRGGRGPLLAWENRMRLMDFLRTQKVTVVLCEFGDIGPLVGDVCTDLGIPYYVIFRGHDASKQFHNPSLLRRQRRVFSQVSGVFAVSRFLADRVAAAGCPEHLLHVAPSGMDPAQFQPGTPEPGRIVAVGRLVEMKAPQITLRAFAQVARQVPHAHLDMVGGGELQAECDAVIAAEDIAAQVTMHGPKDHDTVVGLLARAAMFVQHSITDSHGQTEGFPSAIGEAMGSGLPVVSTRHSGIPEHVLEGKTGLLVDEHDVDGMARAMIRLLENPTLAAELGAAGRAHALENLTRQGTHRKLWKVMDLEACLGIPHPARLNQA